MFAFGRGSIQSPGRSDEWKSSEQLIRNLVDSASKGGNYLLNVGPMANGEIPQPSIERLKDVGECMRVNSSSIYGTTASPFVRLKWGRATNKEYPNATDLFLHVFDWPEDGLFRVDSLRSEVSGAYFRKSHSGTWSSFARGP